MGPCDTELCRRSPDPVQQNILEGKGFWLLLCLLSCSAAQHKIPENPFVSLVGWCLKKNTGLTLGLSVCCSNTTLRGFLNYAGALVKDCMTDAIYFLFVFNFVFLYMQPSKNLMNCSSRNVKGL